MPGAPRPGMRPVYVELPLDLAERLERAARVNRRTLKAEIVLAIERHIFTEPRNAPAVERAESADQYGAGTPIEESQLPTTRGRYLLYLADPILQNGPRWVHFSWRGNNFCLRDFETGGIRRQDRGLSALDVWRAARRRMPATGEFFHPVGDWEWWKAALENLSRRGEFR